MTKCFNKTTHMMQGMLFQFAKCIFALLVIADVASCDPPDNPCPQLFQYKFDGSDWLGLIELNNIKVDQTVNIIVKLSIPTKLPSDYKGRLDLLEDQQKAVQSVLQSKPLLYKITFPLKNPIPRIIEIFVDNAVICNGPPDQSPQTTRFQLYHVFNPNKITDVRDAKSESGPTHDKVVVCYIASWAAYRPGKGSYEIENFDPNLCTHAIYVFAGYNVSSNHIISLDPWQDLKDNYGRGGYERLTDLKKTYPHLKVSIAIGGWNEGSKNYSILAADPARRQTFVNQASEFVRKYNFDGLELHWKYPTMRGGAPHDRKNFVTLVKELRTEFNKHGLVLTSAFGAIKNVIDEAYDVKSLSELLDFMHIMCYDYNGSWDKKVGPNAPLTRDGVLSVEFTIDYLIELGASPSKLVVGLPFYGRTFNTLEDGYYGDASDETGFKGPFTQENGFLGYNEICTMLANQNSGWTISWDTETAQAIAKYRDAAAGITKVVTYDSTRSIANKMRFAVRKQLVGAMIWSVDTDDFLGECGLEKETFNDFEEKPGNELLIPKRINANYPLLRTVNEGIVLAQKEQDQENIIKSKREMLLKLILKL